MDFFAGELGIDYRCDDLVLCQTFGGQQIGQMNYRRFVTYNVAGGILWVLSMILTGYLVGAAVPNINEHIHTVIAVVIFLSILPAIIEILRARRSKSKS
ncbi:MAG: hypothetical protein ACRENG_17975 [bacterium]